MQSVLDNTKHAAVVMQEQQQSQAGSPQKKRGQPFYSLPWIILRDHTDRNRDMTAEHWVIVEKMKQNKGFKREEAERRKNNNKLWGFRKREKWGKRALNVECWNGEKKVKTAVENIAIKLILD